MPLSPVSTPRSRRFSPRLGALVLPAVLALACSTSEDDDASVDDAGTTDRARMAAGVVEGTDIFVATVYDEDRVIAYFCGGDQTYETHTHWFVGEPGDDGAFEHTLGDWRVTGQVDADGASGTLVDPDGTEQAFAIDAAGDSSTAGLYSLDVDDNCRAAAVLTDVGGSTQGQGVYACEDEATFVQVIILAPGDLTANGEVEATVDLGDGEQTLLLPPV